MNTVVRRASSLVAPRSSSSDRDDAASTKSSIKGINTTPAVISPPPTPEPQVAVPSPIAESPAREAESSQADPAPAPAPAPAPSPLAQDPVIPTPPTAPTPEPEAAPTSPQGYVPPPLLDSSAVGPGGFTDDVDELPQPQVIRDPSFVQPEPTETEGNPPVLGTEAVGEEMVESPVEETFAERMVEATAPEPEPQVEVVEVGPQVAPVVADAPAEVVVAERAVAVTDVQEVVSTQPVTPAEPVGEAASYFNLPVQEDPMLVTPAAEATTVEGGAIPQEQSRGLDHEEGIIPPRGMSTPPPQPLAPATSIYPMPVYDVHEVWGGASRKDAEEQRSTIPSMNGDASIKSRASSIRFVI